MLVQVLKLLDLLPPLVSLNLRIRVLSILLLLLLHELVVFPPILEFELVGRVHKGVGEAICFEIPDEDGVSLEVKGVSFLLEGFLIKGTLSISILKLL